MTGDAPAARTAFLRRTAFCIASLAASDAAPGAWGYATATDADDYQSLVTLNDLTRTPAMVQQVLSPPAAGTLQEANGLLRVDRVQESFFESIAAAVGADAPLPPS